jgi:hypothetical protein
LLYHIPKLLFVVMAMYMLRVDPWESDFWIDGEKGIDPNYGFGTWESESEYWLEDTQQYRMVHKIGHGASATVWFARTGNPSRILAIKRFENSERLEVRLRVRNEAQILDTVRHGVRMSIGHGWLRPSPIKRHFLEELH